MAATTTADALLREAHERGYRFPVTFHGFTAQIDWETPAGSGEGTVEVQLGDGDTGRDERARRLGERPAALADRASLAAALRGR